MQNKKNVLVYGLGNNLGGIENFIFNYVINTNSQHIQFDFVCYDNKPVYYQELLNIGSNIYIITSRRKNYISHRKQLKDIFEKKKYDAVWSNIVSLSDILILKYAYIYKVKKRIVHAHNAFIRPELILTIVLHHINKMQLKKYCTNFWACSQKAGRFMFPNQLFQSPVFKIIHNAIDIKKFLFSKEKRAEKRKEINIKDKFVIGHVGDFCFEKNHSFLIQVFSEIYKKRNDAVLVLIGNGKLLEKIKFQAEKLGLQENVYFLGKRTDISGLLHAMDVFMFPSWHEGLWISVIEAQATGLKCFISDALPPELLITNLVHPISLKKPAVLWANTILEKQEQDIERRTDIENMKRAGYDIRTEAAYLENWFIKHDGETCNDS